MNRYRDQLAAKGYEVSERYCIYYRADGCVEATNWYTDDYICQVGDLTFRELELKVCQAFGLKPVPVESESSSEPASKCAPVSDAPVACFILIAVDYGRGCSGNAVVIGIYNFESEAVNIACKDIVRWAEYNDGTADVENLRAVSNSDPAYKCEWQIHRCAFKPNAD